MFIGDSLFRNNNQPFSTKNRDNDDTSSCNCAVARRSGWWHQYCTYANLNGQYYGSEQENNVTAIYWLNWKNDYKSMKRVGMKIKLN